VSSAPPAIRVESLVRDFDRVRAIDHLSLEIPAGTVFGFLGPNGAGKTTMIRTLLGLLEPTAGRAEVLGFDTRTQAHEIRRRAGALLEHAGLYERLSAADNLEFYGRIGRMPKSARLARAKDLLDQFGLWDRRTEPVGRWSRGMKQKLAVARAVFHRPSLVFLDEPTAGLDPVSTAALREDLAALSKSEGVTIFLTTHNLSEAERLCGLVGVIREGRLLALGKPSELRAHDTPRVEITATNVGAEILARIGELPGVAAVHPREDGLIVEMQSLDAPVAPIVAFLVESGVPVEEVRKHRASLEETFLALVRRENGRAENGA
jgi:ABC-2 type transport system ATP-binding protein